MTSPSVTKLTWIGAALAIVGWIVLLAGGGIAPALGLALDAAHVATIGQTLVLCGVGLAILDALHAGFGALNRFFEAILQRSAARPPQPTHMPARAPAEPEAPANDITERGRLNGRAYLRYRDGSVEIETLLGVRRFASVEEAEEFVG
jgi:hypothetical protein